MATSESERRPGTATDLDLTEEQAQDVMGGIVTNNNDPDKLVRCSATGRGFFAEAT
ncbi:MAG: hypothetical protein ACREM3_25945 [Candidatus Rokuibacteriota bacterium]